MAVQAADKNYEGVWDGRLGFGKKSAIIVIDLLQGYTTEGSALYAPGVVACVKEVPELLEVARAKGVPIIHTQVRYTPPDYADGGVWIKKAPVLKDLVEGNPYAAFCEEVVPKEGEIIITKQYASAFFGTSLVATLTGLGVDTLIITGCTTSGCIRATAVDAVQHGFRPSVYASASAIVTTDRMKRTCSTSMRSTATSSARLNVWSILRGSDFCQSLRSLNN